MRDNAIRRGVISKCHSFHTANENMTDEKNTPQPRKVMPLKTVRQTKFDRLYSEQREIEKAEAFAAGDVGYLNKVLVQATLPYREPDPNLIAWGRRAGNVALAIQPGATIDVSNGKPISIGYPYGVIPRLALAWLGKEIKRQKSREIDLTHNLTSFMSEIGFDHPTGGKNGSIGAVKKQLQRLFAARLSLLEIDPKANDMTDYASAKFMEVAGSAVFWRASVPGQESLFATKIVLGEQFYEAFKSGVPIDIRAMRALGQSPLEIDIFCWLCYRLAYLTKTAVVPWEALQAQFGTETQNEAKFRWQIKRALNSISVVYPGAKFDSSGRAGLKLFPSLPAIARAVKEGKC